MSRVKCRYVELTVAFPHVTALPWNFDGSVLAFTATKVLQLPAADELFLRVNNPQVTALLRLRCQG